MRKCQKLDTSISSMTTSNGALLSYYARVPTSRSSASNPNTQVVELPHITINWSNPVPKEIIDLEASSNDLGEHVPQST